jgi:hypothetical protein
MCNKLRYCEQLRIFENKILKKDYDSTYRNFKVLNMHHSIFKLHLLRIAKFALGVRQFIAAFNDGIYSVPSKCSEINFTKQGGNQSTLRSYARHSKLPHSMERCHARKSKIHSNIFEITFPFEVGTSIFSVRYSIVQKLRRFGRLIEGQVQDGFFS